MINELSYTDTKNSYFHSISKILIPSPNKNYPIIGNSDAMIKIKKQILFSSKIRFVIFLSGENGCEKASTAWHIHNLGNDKSDKSDKSDKFITIPANINDAISYKDYLLRSLVLANNGTLYIEDVDDLNNDKKDILLSLFSLDNFLIKLKEKNIRLIISCTQACLSTKHQQFISELLGTSVPHFNFHLPPLRERTEDIRDHVDFILSNLGIEIDITDSALSLLKQYDWPGNIAELQKLILFVASYSDQIITDQDILSLGIIEPNLTSNKKDLIEHLLDQELAYFHNMHPSVQKALTFLSQNFLNEITLDLLATSAFISPSHLSYLFRYHLNTSFKTILNQMRVQFAKRKINEMPTVRITDVCMLSGFGDLSHFEKMFKRYLDCTPREYRNIQRSRLKKAYM